MTFVEKWFLVIDLIFIICIAVLVWQMRKAIKAQTAPHVEPPTVSGYHWGRYSSVTSPQWANQANAYNEDAERSVSETIEKYDKVIAEHNAKADAEKKAEDAWLKPYADFMNRKMT